MQNAGTVVFFSNLEIHYGESLNLKGLSSSMCAPSYNADSDSTDTDIKQSHGRKLRVK